MLSQPIADALTALPVPGLPVAFFGLGYRSQTSTEPMATPFVVIEETGVVNLTAKSLRKVSFEIRLYTNPDATPPPEAPEVLRLLEAHLQTVAFLVVLAASMPVKHKVVSWRMTGMPAIRIEDRTVTDTLTGTATIGIDQP